MVHIPTCLCDVAHIVLKATEEKRKKEHISTNSSVDVQLTCGPSLYWWIQKLKEFLPILLSLIIQLICANINLFLNSMIDGYLWQ